MKRLFSLFLLIAAGWIFWVVTAGLPRRVTTVVVGEPVRVASWDESNGELVVVELPAQTVVEATGGYGAYELRAIWELGEIENQAGVVFAQSVGEALGIPVSYFLGPHISPNMGEEDLFSFSSVWDAATGKRNTNIPLPTHLALAWRFLFLRPDDRSSVSLSPNRGLASSVAPDGSTRLVFDANQADVLLGSSFEDEEIRREGLSVAVYNTTTAGSLGTRVARMLSHLGYLVVTVANEEPVVDRCELQVGSNLVKSVSVETIIHALGCEVIKNDEPKRADLVVRVGTQYARRFLPGYSP